jgi:hypothetical protein
MFFKTNVAGFSIATPGKLLLNILGSPLLYIAASRCGREPLLLVKNQVR